MTTHIVREMVIEPISKLTCSCDSISVPNLIPNLALPRIQKLCMSMGPGAFEDVVAAGV